MPREQHTRDRFVATASSLFPGGSQEGEPFFPTYAGLGCDACILNSDELMTVDRCTHGYVAELVQWTYTLYTA